MTKTSTTTAAGPPGARPLRGIAAHCTRRLDEATTALEVCDLDVGACRTKLVRCTAERRADLVVVPPAPTAALAEPLDAGVDGLLVVLAIAAAAVTAGGLGWLLGKADLP